MLTIETPDGVVARWNGERWESDSPEDVFMLTTITTAYVMGRLPIFAGYDPDPDNLLVEYLNLAGYDCRRIDDGTIEYPDDDGESILY
jgi:hypothetical protein